MTAGSWLRLAVWVVAVAGLVDPRLTSMRRPPLSVDVAVPRAGEPDGASAPPAATGGTTPLLDALARATDDDVRLRVRTYADGDRLPCAAEAPCVVVTSEAVAPRGGFSRQVPLLTLAPPPTDSSGSVELVDVRVAPVRLDDAAIAQVTLSGVAAGGRTTVVELRDDGAPVGRLRHTWGDQSAVTLDVPWWPAQAGMRRLEVSATTLAPDGTASPPQRLVATVDVDPEPWPVLVIEARPSWATTFVRRALEDDRRFAVDAVRTLAPGLASGRGDTAIDDARVSRARVVVLGGLEAFTAVEVARVERFVRHRGGALVLVPDAAVAGPITALVPGRWRRLVEARASAADGGGEGTGASITPAALRASEWLVGADLGPGDDVLATHDGAPVAVARPLGDGQVVVVGALDAWRFRLSAPADEAPTASAPAAGASPLSTERTPGYAEVWQALAADLARGTGAPVDVRVTHAPGDAAATVDVQARTMAPRALWSASARLVCGAVSAPLPLWAQARAGHFRARAPWPAAGTACDIVAAVADVGEGRASLTAPGGRAEARRVAARLAALATASGGIAAGPGDTAAVAQRLAALRSTAPEGEAVWPMRSWWWGAVAMLGLGGDWWWRRRRGLR